MKKRKSYLPAVNETIQELGFSNPKDFINTWIKGGHTFADLKDHILLTRDVDIPSPVLWAYFRKRLKIPYTAKDQLYYRWNAVAKAKGYEDLERMVKDLIDSGRKSKDISEELGVGAPTVRRILGTFSRPHTPGKVGKRFYFKRHRRARDKDEIYDEKIRKKWKKTLRTLGFRDLKDAIRSLKKAGYRYKDMHVILKVKRSTLLLRRRRVGLVKFKRENPSSILPEH